MIRILCVIVAVLLISPAHARHYHHHHHHHHHRHGRLPWCGFYMMQVEGKTDRRLALAREWAREGINAGGPAIGVIVVWRHHVGKIVGYENGQWIINSGNDGGRVRTRPRSVTGAIAFRRL